MRKRNLLFAVVLLTLPVFLSAQPKNVIFTDVAGKAGITFKYTIGDYSYKNIIESSGSGITIFDYNNDGLMDIYLMNGTYLEGISDSAGKVFRNSHNELYRNNGNGTFTEVSEKAGVAGKQWCMAASAIDLDNDGFQDLYVLNYGPNVFYRNNGNGTFTDITAKLGLAGPEKLNGFAKWSIGASFWDYNLDGRLDVMVGNFMAFDPAYFTPGSPDMMPSPTEYKGQTSNLYEQQPNGKFSDVTQKKNLFYPDSKNMGKGIYVDISETSGIAGAMEGKGSWGSALFDYDNDGDLDLIATNGTAEDLILQYPILLENDGKGHFKNVGKDHGSYFSAKKSGRGLAICDFDNDGNLDVIISHVDNKPVAPALLRNEGGTGNHWLGLTLKGKNGPASAISAKITVSSGGKKQIFVNQWATSYLSNNEPRIHIGLGQQKKVDQVEISWSDGKMEIFKNIEIDKYVTILQGSGNTDK